MNSALHRHDICDDVWERISPHLPGSKGHVGRRGADNRRFINAVQWVARTGAPWRDLPPDYGHWNTVHKRYRAWCERGVWGQLLERFADDPDFAWLMIDASHLKVHPHAAGAVGGNEGMGRTKGG